MEIIIQECLDLNGNSPFAKWFNKLNAPAAAKITTALYRLGKGNYSNAKNLKGGVFEYKINFGPGYRIYFAKDDDKLIILLGGGTKKRQSDDITAAKDLWQEYKKLKLRS